MELSEETSQMDNNELEIIINSYQNKLISASKRIVQDHETARDIVQDSLISYHSNKEQFKSKSLIYTYLYRIVVNKSIDCLRKIKSRQKNESSYFSLAKLNQEDKDQDMKIIMENALNKLPVKYKVPLILLEYEQLNYKEIGEILNIPMSNLKITIFRAREKLLKILTKMGVNL